MSATLAPNGRPLTQISTHSTLVGSACDEKTVAFALPASAASAAAAPPHPTPAAPRPNPKANQFDIAYIKNLPKRLFSPPRPSPAPERRQTSQALGSRMANVTLGDVLANKHLSPLSLVDFEGYLAHKELSAENLYFVLWLTEYTKLWNEQGPARADAPLALLPEPVQASLTLALDTFFSPNAALELNLSNKLRDLTLVAAAETGHPTAFAPAQDHVLAALEHSLGGFKRVLSGNAGFARLGMCFVLGCVMFAVGLVPSIVAITGHHSRWWHLLGWPSLLLGSATASMAPQRICAAVWFLGNDRQMLPWEVKPTCLSASLVAIPHPSSPGFGSEDSSTHSASSANPFPWAKFETFAPTPEADHPAPAPTPAPVPASHQSDNESSASFPPIPSPPVISPSSPVFAMPPPYSVKHKEVATEATPFLAPVTRVLSDDVAREHWRVVRRGFMIGFVVMCVVGGSLMAA